MFASSSSSSSADAAEDGINSPAIGLLTPKLQGYYYDTPLEMNSNSKSNLNRQKMMQKKMKSKNSAIDIIDEQDEEDDQHRTSSSDEFIYPMRGIIAVLVSIVTVALFSVTIVVSLYDFVDEILARLRLYPETFSGTEDVIAFNMKHSIIAAVAFSFCLSAHTCIHNLVRIKIYYTALYHPHVALHSWEKWFVADGDVTVVDIERVKDQVNTSTSIVSSFGFVGYFTAAMVCSHFYASFVISILLFVLSNKYFYVDIVFPYLSKSSTIAYLSSVVSIYVFKKYIFNASVTDPPENTIKYHNLVAYTDFVYIISALVAGMIVAIFRTFILLIWTFRRVTLIDLPVLSVPWVVGADLAFQSFAALLIETRQRELLRSSSSSSSFSSLSETFT